MEPARRHRLPAPAHELDERQLIAAAQADPRRFAALYDLHFERVYAYVARRVANRAEAEDVTSEVFHQALANLPRFEWRGAPFAAWLYRIAANAIADRWQRAARERGNPAAVESAAANDPQLEAVEQSAQLFRLVDALPADQQRVLRMRFVEERSIRDIAAALGRSEGAVKQLQFRALESLRARMSEQNG
jgi:RNA polymerase sigma-70 factor (ECF subfamily)